MDGRRRIISRPCKRCGKLYLDEGYRFGCSQDCYVEFRGRKRVEKPTEEEKPTWAECEPVRFLPPKLGRPKAPKLAKKACEVCKQLFQPSCPSNNICGNACRRIKEIRQSNDRWAQPKKEQPKQKFRYLALT